MRGVQCEDSQDQEEETFMKSEEAEDIATQTVQGEHEDHDQW